MIKINQNPPSYLIVVLLLFSVFGCSTHIVAEKYPVDRKMLPDFSSKNAISITNQQLNKKEVKFSTNRNHNYLGNLSQFTDVAIETLEGELKNQGIIVENTADKKIGIAVTKIDIQANEWSGFWCESIVKVETGDGYKAEIDGHDSNAWILFPCIHGALNHAVVAVLNDDKVIEYLKR